MNFTYDFCDIYWFCSLTYEVTSISEGHTAFLFKAELRLLGTRLVIQENGKNAQRRRKIVLLPVTDTEARRSSFSAGVGEQGRLFYCRGAGCCTSESRKTCLCHDENLKCYTSEFLTYL
jgi:hypothetical protein